MRKIAAGVLALALIAAGCSSAKDKEPAPAETFHKMTAEEMDKEHAEGIKQFPAKTEGKGNQLLQPKVEGNVKVYDLTVSKIKWEVDPGHKVDAYAYNGQLPGPVIRVTEGDRVRVNVKNAMDEGRPYRRSEGSDPAGEVRRDDRLPHGPQRW